MIFIESTEEMPDTGGALPPVVFCLLTLARLLIAFATARIETMPQPNLYLEKSES